MKDITSKYSGYDWLGEVPKDWLVSKNRYYLKHKKTEKNESNKTQVLSLTTRGIKIKENLSFGKSTESYIGHQMVDKGDIVFTPRDFDQTPILSDVSKFSGCISNLYIVDETTNGLLNYFLNFYWYGLKYSCDYFKNFSHGMRYSFNRFQFDEIPLLIPPLKEQEEIVSHLNKKTYQIEELIKKIEKKIELLKEYRSSLINEVVTKGLNPIVDMKDTGIEWIGKIPSHWQLLRLNNLGRFSKGKGITKDKIKENGNKCIRCGEIYTTYELRFNRTRSFIDDDTSDESVLATKGVLLFTGDGESLEEIGKCIVYEGEEELYIGGGINVFTPKQEKVIPIYLSYVMNSESVIYQKSRQGKGEIVVHIYSKQLKEIRLGLPSIKEQQQIVEYLDQKTSLIDKIISDENKRLLFLKEYKKSLISEVVTGKKRVV